MQYPLGIFSFVCIVIFAWVQNWVYHPVGRWAISLWGLWTLGLILVLSRHAVKTFFAAIILSLSVILFALTSLNQRKTGGQFLRGTFVFDKVFRTEPHRMGGIGRLTLQDGRKIPLYIHGHKKNKRLQLENRTPYAFSGYVSPLKDPFTTSGNFSFYLWSRGVRYHTTSGKLWPQPHRASWLKRGQQSFFNALKTSDERASNVFRAILMGKKEALTQTQQQHFFYTGTMHLFAVSGLHVGVVSAFLFFLCKALMFPLTLRCILTGLGVIFYATLVGFSPSTMRATLMILFLLLAQIVQRPVDVRAAFFNTTGVTLLINPFSLWDVGFQLSYGVVASILFIGIPLSLYYAQKRSFGVSGWQLTCIVSVCASGMSTLFSVYYWHLLCPWAFLANLFLIPLASGIVVLGLCAWISSLIAPILLPAVTVLAQACVLLLLKIVQWMEKMPGSHCCVSLSSVSFFSLLFLFCLTVFCIPTHFNSSPEHSVNP